MTETKVCPQTGEVFVPKRYWQRFKDNKARQHYHAGWRERANAELQGLKVQLAEAEKEAAQQRERADKLASDVQVLKSQYVKGKA